MHTYIFVNCEEDIKVNGDREEKNMGMKKKKSPTMTDEKRERISCTTEAKRQVKDDSRISEEGEKEKKKKEKKTNSLTPTPTPTKKQRRMSGNCTQKDNK